MFAEALVTTPIRPVQAGDSLPSRLPSTSNQRRCNCQPALVPSGAQLQNHTLQRVLCAEATPNSHFPSVVWLLMNSSSRLIQFIFPITCSQSLLATCHRSSAETQEGGREV